LHQRQFAGGKNDEEFGLEHERKKSMEIRRLLGLDECTRGGKGVKGRDVSVEINELGLIKKLAECLEDSRRFSECLRSREETESVREVEKKFEAENKLEVRSQ
jgi:hypothetical protein